MREEKEASVLCAIFVCVISFLKHVRNFLNNIYVQNNTGNCNIIRFTV